MIRRPPQRAEVPGAWRPPSRREVAGWLAGALGWTACGAPAGSGPSPAGGALVVALGLDPGNLNPLVLPYQVSQVVSRCIQLPLVEPVIEPGGLAWRPGLARAWRWEDGGRTLVHEMHPGLAWEDGHPLTSADVAFTWELMRDPVVASNWLKDAQRVEAVETPNPSTVVFRFAAPANPVLLMGVAARGIVPRHVLADADRATLRGHPSARQPLASGPWRLARWKPSEVLVLEPNPRCRARPRPRLDRIVLRVVPEYGTRLIEFEAGRIHLLPDVEVGDLPRLEAAGAQVLVREATSMQYLGWNLRDPRFADVRVRRALAMAVDRDALIDRLFTVAGRRYARPCVGTVAPTLAGWFADDLAPLPYDPEGARARLDAAGWRVDPAGDGLRSRDGQPLRATVLVQNGYPVLQRIAVVIQEALRQVGMDLRIQLLEPNRFAHLAREHDFEAILWSFGANPRVDLSIQWHSTGPYNWMQFSDPEVDAWIEEAAATPDLDRARALARRVQHRVHDLQPAIFLFWQDEAAVAHPRLRNVRVNPASFLDLSETWSWADEEGARG